MPRWIRPTVEVLQPRVLLASAPNPYDNIPNGYDADAPIMIDADLDTLENEYDQYLLWSLGEPFVPNNVFLDIDQDNRVQIEAIAVNNDTARLAQSLEDHGFEITRVSEATVNFRAPLDRLTDLAGVDSLQATFPVFKDPAPADPPRMDRELLALRDEYEAYTGEPGWFAASAARQVTICGDYVRINVIGDDLPALASRLCAECGFEEFHIRDWNLTGLIPISALSKLPDVQGLQFATFAPREDYWPDEIIVDQSASPAEVVDQAPLIRVWATERIWPAASGRESFHVLSLIDQAPPDSALM